MRFVIYRPADKRPRIGLNQYFKGTPEQKTIGIAAVMFGRCFSWVWRKA